MKKYLFIVLCVVLLFTVGCNNEDTEEELNGDTANVANEDENEGDTNMPNEDVNNEVVEVPAIITGSIVMEDGGVIEFELYPHIAPQSVRNFVYLSRQGFYDGLAFHRIISGFMIQGGCPDGNGTGGPGHSIVGEFADNGIENPLSHVRGVISMARSAPYDSAGSQFFICHGDSTFLDDAYAAFGMVTSGMDVVDRLAQTPVTDGNGSVAPENMPVIRSITIDGDFEMPPPDKLPR